MTDGPPPRHLHPVEPPYDPDYDSAAGARPAPHDVDAERAVLTALLLKPTLAPTLATELTHDDFYRPQHATLWDAIHHLAGHTTDDTPAAPLDVILLANHLRTTGHLDRIGGPTYLTDLTGNPVIPDHATHYARIVRDHSRARTLIDLGTRLRDAGHKADPTTLETTFAHAIDHLDAAALRLGPTTTRANTGLADLTWLTTGEEPPTQPPPTWATRTDGTALFYNGVVNGVFGDPEHGKTWLAQIAGIEALTTGGTFAMIDVDHNGANHTAARLLLLGANPHHLADPDRFRYYEPEDADQLLAAVTDITTWTPDIVVLDSLGEIFPMLGVSTNDGDEMTTAMRKVCTPPAAAGSCVITIDHLPKSADARATGYAIGSIAKKRAVRGAYIRAEARVKPAPGQIGRITLRIEKDTPGELRRTSGGGYAGTLTLDSTQPHTTTWEIGRDEPPKNDDGTFRPTGYMEKVAAFVADHPECSGRDIETGIPGTAKHIRSALLILVSEGHIARTPGPRRSQLHTLVIPYREAEDDHAQQTL